MEGKRVSLYVMVYLFGRLLICYSTLPLLLSASPSRRPHVSSFCTPLRLC